MGGLLSPNSYFPQSVGDLQVIFLCQASWSVWVYALLLILISYLVCKIL